MNFIILENHDEISSAYQSFSKAIKDEASAFQDRTIDFRGGAHKGIAYWNEMYKFWSMFVPWLDRHWCYFGITDPTNINRLWITTEISVIKSGIDQRLSGLFIKDHQGNVYVSHTGKVHGKSEVAKNALLNYLKDDQVKDVSWSDGKPTKAYVIGKVNDPKLPEKLGEFVNNVHAFKEGTWKKHAGINQAKFK